MRIDRRNQGKIDKYALEQFMIDNQHKEFLIQDFVPFLAYFDLDKDLKLKYRDWLQVVLTCGNQEMRAQTTQRESKVLESDELLPMRVERALAVLIVKELKFHQKLEELKVMLKNGADYESKRAFASIDTEGRGWWDMANLKKFMKAMKCMISK